MYCSCMSFGVVWYEASCGSKQEVDSGPDCHSPPPSIALLLVGRDGPGMGERGCWIWDDRADVKVMGMDGWVWGGGM